MTAAAASGQSWLRAIRISTVHPLLSQRYFTSASPHPRSTSKKFASVLP
jgi:hypothetical protein